MKIDFSKLHDIDRRWLFLAMAVALTLPLLFPFNLPFKTSKMVEDLYNAVDKLPEGSIVLVSSDFAPSAAPELYPFSVALYHHLFRKNIKVVTMTLWPEGAPLIDAALEETAILKYNKVYGKDFVTLGFKDGKVIVIRGITRELRAFFPRDNRGTPIENLPIMNGIFDINDFDLFINISSGSPGIKEWVQQAQSRLNFDMVAAVTAVSALDYIPYYQANQLQGLAAGMRGSADYELLVGEPGVATSGMDAQNLGHILIVISIIMGNVFYFRNRKSRLRYAKPKKV